MKIIEQIAYYTFVVGWIVAPLIVRDVLASRNIILPSDMAIKGVAIWYAIPLVQLAWLDRHKPSQRKKGYGGPSYTDKGQNDWP